MGTLPYSERLDILKLTTLAERRVRGDLIEAFKAVNDRTCVGGNLFSISNFRSNLVSGPRVSKGNVKVQNLSRSFLTNRVVNLWNMLPLDVKCSDSVNSFKINLQAFKNNNIGEARVGNFWDVSDEVLSRIEGPGYLANKAKHNEFLRLRPYIAKKKFINLTSSGLLQ